ncbi:hypothetical protein DOY81_007302 [Sarcophaga bullata]|nr:hypothetical protein DOY81_007302 [Sarcophaga bullata]
METNLTVGLIDYSLFRDEQLLINDTVNQRQQTVVTWITLCLSFAVRVWINQGDIILVGLRDYQDSKADVILKYTSDEARNLKTYGEFPESVRINDTVTFVEDGFDEDIEFGDEISSDDDADSVDNI